MPGDNLKIDLEEMRKKATDLQTAIDGFNDFAKKPFDSEIKMLNGMNTDFGAKLVTMLENLNDDNSKMVSSIEKIQELTQKVVKNFEKRDKDAAQSIGIVE